MRRNGLDHLYHVVVAIVAVTLLVGILGAMIFILVQGLTESFFGVDLTTWISRQLEGS